MTMPADPIAPAGLRAAFEPGPAPPDIAAQAPQAAAYVRQAVANLTGELDRLEAVLTTLEDRLDIVLQPAAPRPTDAAGARTGDGPWSALAIEVEVRVGRLARLTEKLADLRDRVDL